jgi:aerobic-type carbon monoxide dehydrogenase small subunit (CoxS/CutS family)
LTNKPSLFEIAFKVNGEEHLMCVETRWTLLDVLRTSLGLTGAKRGCDMGECGTCTVIFNGKAINSCQLLAVELHGSEVTTIEGISDGVHLNPVQRAFVENDGGQCGFCTPGFIMSTVALLESNVNPSDQEISNALGGNLCRCNAYSAILDSVRQVSRKLTNE